MPSGHPAPASFYTGIVADLYGPLRASRTEVEPYANFIARSGEPALELGCGDGEPLLDLLERGIDVVGLDSSADMLARCVQRGAERGLVPIVYHQPMETMDLGRRFRSIFIAGPTFNLLPDDDTALLALVRIREHLAENGSVLIPLFVPEPTPAEAIGVPRSRTRADGARMTLTTLSEQRDDTARLQVTLLRYELAVGDSSTTDDRPWLLHWYSQDQFRALAEAAGLTVSVVLSPTGGRAAPDADTAVFVLR